MRSLVALAVFSAGCVCTPLSEICGGARGACPTQAQVESEGLNSSRMQWIMLGECTRAKVGSDKHGTWIDPGGLDTCLNVSHFDRGGRLIARSHCCNGICGDWGLGPRIEPGPATRDLCAEVGAQLLTEELLRAKTAGVTRLIASDGGTPDNVNSIWWLLPHGQYTAELSDGGRASFEVIDGGAVIPSGLSWLTAQGALSPPHDPRRHLE